MKPAALLTALLITSSAPARTIQLDTTRVTAAGVALAPDDRTVIFTLLGHLFRIPATGGTAEQLTFGPYYDAEPALSPDASEIAFTSDRDGSEANIFVLALKDGRITQLTRDKHVGRPIWSADGKSIFYLRYETWIPRFTPRDSVSTAVVMRVARDGTASQPVTAPPKRLTSVFLLPDGRAAWSMIEQDAQSGSNTTRIEALNADGSPETLRTISGYIDRVQSSPSGDGFYSNRITRRSGGFLPTAEDIVFVPSTTGREREVTPVAGLARFAVSGDGKRLVIGDEGRLWSVLTSSGGRQPIPLQAHVTLEVQEIIRPAARSASQGSAHRMILTPRLSPDGRMLVFGAAGFVWKQSLNGNDVAQRITHDDKALESEPAFSPDGHMLAYVRTQHGQDSIRILDFATGAIRSLTSAHSFSELAWSPDGRRLLALVDDGGAHNVAAFDITNAKSDVLFEATDWSPRPQLSTDQRTLWFSSDLSGIGNLYAREVGGESDPRQITHLTRHLSDARISPDGRWVVFRRNRAILKAPMSASIGDADVSELASEGGDSFALTPDGTAVIYSIGPRVFLQPLNGGGAKEIPVHLNLPRETPPPLLLRNVRVMNPDAKSFRDPASMLIADGRIQWIGNPAEHELPPRTESVDCGGRFAIPGLFDMHAHSAGADEQAFLAYGVTSVRDPGGPLAWIAAMEDRAETTGKAAITRHFYSGEIFEGDRPMGGDGFLQIDRDDDARVYVRSFQRLGVSFIKAYPSLSWPLKRTVAAEARRLGLPVVGHGMSVEEIVKSITLGFTTLEHTTELDRCYDDVFQLMAATGTPWDPTLEIAGAASLLLRDEPQRFAAAASSESINRTLPIPVLRGAVAALLAEVARAHELGVTLLAGTDCPSAEIPAGYSLHWELARLVEAGLPPEEVIRIATTDAAAVLGLQDLGCLEPGKLADVVLLDANPLENIHNTEKIWRTMKAGRLFEPLN